MSQSETPRKPDMTAEEAAEYWPKLARRMSGPHPDTLQEEIARLRAELAEANAEVKYQRTMRNDALCLYDAAQAEVTRLMHLSNGYVAENERLRESNAK